MTELVVFAKYWEPGKVKTRLAAQIGAGNASRVYHAFLDCTLERLQGMADRQQLCVSPKGRRQEFEKLVRNRGWTTTVQSNGDLGKRMSAMFQERLRTPTTSRVVLIGSDSPDLPNGHVQRAFDLLCDHDVVLGPTPDGGYYLVGLSTSVPAMFVDIPWSTDRVLKKTLTALRDSGNSFELLPEFPDVDEFEDLQSLWRCLSQRDNLDAGLSCLRRRLMILSSSGLRPFD